MSPDVNRKLPRLGFILGGAFASVSFRVGTANPGAVPSSLRLIFRLVPLKRGLRSPKDEVSAHTLKLRRSRRGGGEEGAKICCDSSIPTGQHFRGYSSSTTNRLCRHGIIPATVHEAACARNPRLDHVEKGRRRVAGIPRRLQHEGSLRSGTVPRLLRNLRGQTGFLGLSGP